MTVETYLAATGQTAEALQAGARSEAELAVKRELVLEAVADQLGTEVGDDEIEELDSQGSIRGRRGSGRDDRRPCASAEASSSSAAICAFGSRSTRSSAGSSAIPVELAQAREKLWTPEKEKGSSGMKIWTPGSEEPR